MLKSGSLKIIYNWLQNYHHTTKFLASKEIIQTLFMMSCAYLKTLVVNFNRQMHHLERSIDVFMKSCTYWENPNQRRIQMIHRPCEKPEISLFCSDFQKIFPDFGRYLKFLPCEFTIFTWFKSAPDILKCSSKSWCALLLMDIILRLPV